MKKDVALFLTASLVFFAVGNYFLLETPLEGERVVIQRAIDGDTVELIDGRTIRLININTPEKKERGSNEALSFFQQFENRSVILHDKGKEKYGRTLGALYEDELYLNLELVRLGLAHSFLVEEGETKRFIEAQHEALIAERGIWQHSPLYGCLSAEINKKDEYVFFVSSCNTSLVGWTVKDETTQRYRFSANPDTRFFIYSEKGSENTTALYWNRGSVWNNDRDTVFVRDTQELLVFSDSYGYGP